MPSPAHPPLRRLAGVVFVGGFGVGVAVSATQAVVAGPSVASSKNNAEHVVLAVATAQEPTQAVDPRRRTSVVDAVQAVAPAVVSITTEVNQVDPFFLRSRSTSSEGSGVVIDEDGIVLTNDHVIAGATRILANFADGRQRVAELVGTAPELDLAVLRLRTEPGDAFTAVSVGDSSELMLGEPVIAIGNPFGLGHTVTTGIVSAVSRPLETESRVYQDFIQTDASINPGNSGGPLLDATGRLIGINTAIRPDAQGIGFAIPVDRAAKVARDLLEFGTVQVPWLGADLDDVALRTRSGRRVAVEVSAVWPEGQAAGLQPGDVILEVDGRAVQGRADLNAYLSGSASGGTVSATVVRGGTRLDAPLKLPTHTVSDAVVDAIVSKRLGIEVSATGGRGLVVTRTLPSGAFAQRGLRAGDRILALHNTPVSTVDDLRSQVAAAKSGHRGSALFTIQRRDIVGRVALPL